SYSLRHEPKSSRVLIDALREPSIDATLPLYRYRELAGAVPDEAIERMHAAWGDAENDSEVHDGAFRFRARTFGNIVVAFPPDRGRSTERGAHERDTNLPRRHPAPARARCLRHRGEGHARIHLGPGAPG